MSIDFIKSIYYEILSYFVPQRIKNKIVGQCIKCGQCCRQIRSYELKSAKEFKFMSYIFPYYKNFYITGKDKDGHIILCCKHIGDDNKCKIYNKRPLICKKYPQKYTRYNIQMLDGCGFKVIKKEFKDYLTE